LWKKKTEVQTKMHSPPSLWMSFRQTIGRALRETGQALDRLAIMAKDLATTTRVVGDNPYIFDDHLSRHRNRMPLLKRGAPIVSPNVAFVAPCSTLIGSVRVGPGASIWYKAVLRADSCYNSGQFRKKEQDEMDYVWEIDVDYENPTRSDLNSGGLIRIGENSNVQDGVIITSQVNHTIIGKGVTIGHLAQIHSSKVDDFCLVGMGSILCENVTVGRETFIAAGAVVPPGSVIPEGELWVGNPARKLRDLSATERGKLHYQSDEVRFITFNTQVQWFEERLMMSSIF
jgi:gamma-carbonic anhydrase